MDDAMRKLQSEVDRELIDQILSLRSDVARFKEDHGQACKTIADMHAAALGEVCGPIRGVVEDVADLRESFEKKSAEAYRARVRVNQSELREETLRREFAEIESLRAELESAETSEAAWEIESDKWKARAEKAERERDEAYLGEQEITKDFDRAFHIFVKMKYTEEQAGGCCPPEGGMTEIAEVVARDFGKLRAALDAADRLAEMVRQHAAQNAGYGASSDITTGDIGQEYEFYQAARAAVGKASA